MNELAHGYLSMGNFCQGIFWLLISFSCCTLWVAYEVSKDKQSEKL